MKGISPVIATVLLLLMAVAAVGGAWVWYQRMQVSAQLGGETGISNIKATTSLQSVYVDRLYDVDGAGNYTLYLGNQGSDTVQINSIQIMTSDDSSFQTCNTTYTSSNTLDIGSTEFGTVICYDYDGSGAYTSGENVEVKVYASGASITRVATAE